VVLLVNTTDATSVVGDKRRFMCHGLHDLANLKFIPLTPGASAEASKIRSTLRIDVVETS
jgi:hypothetical protein